MTAGAPAHVRALFPHPTGCWWCHGTGWTCEDHPDRPFLTTRQADECGCGAAGAPCQGPQTQRELEGITRLLAMVAAVKERKRRSWAREDTGGCGQ